MSDVSLIHSVWLLNRDLGVSGYKETEVIIGKG